MIASIATLAWSLVLCIALTLDDPRLRFPTYALGVAISGLGWLGLIRAARIGTFDHGPPTALLGLSRAAAALVGLGLLARIVALSLSPAFSEDVFRYVYEGRVVWHHGLAFPFAHAPATAPLVGVAPQLLDHAWLRINHPELSTIYRRLPSWSSCLPVGSASCSEAAI